MAYSGSFFMIVVLLYWDSLKLSMRGVFSSSSSAARNVIFASMRFVNGQPLPEALELQTVLRNHGITLKIVQLTAGADITQEVFESIEQAEAFLVFGTKNYGEKTGNTACVALHRIRTAPTHRW